MHYIIDPIKNTLDFDGKTSLSQFWFFFVAYVLLGIFFTIISSVLKIEAIKNIYRILMLLPLISISFRRLNDAGFIKWLFLIPLAGIVLAAFPSKKGEIK